MSTGEHEASLTLLREQGNRSFREKNYKKAVELYSDCLLLSPADYHILSNRSAAYLGLGYLEDAYHDAKQCVSLSGSFWPKAHYRLGTVLEKLERWSHAIEAFNNGLALDPANIELEKKVVIATQEVEARDIKLKSQLAMFRRDAVFRLKRSRRMQAKDALIAQYKESMSCPEWEPDEYEWRPTFLNSMKVERKDCSLVEDDSCAKILIPFLKNLSDLATPRECIDIVRNKERLKFFEQELQAAINAKPDCHVVVVGYWSCILGLIAAKNGAKKVTCIEQCQSMYKLTNTVLDLNKALLDPLCPINVVPVDIYHCTGSQELTEEDTQRVFVEEADIFVSDLFNHSVLDYGILRVLDHARKEFLKNDCLVIPSVVEVSAAVIDTTVSYIADFDFSCLNRYQWQLHHQKISKKGYFLITPSPLYGSNRNTFKQLSGAFQLLKIDLQNRKTEEIQSQSTVSTVVKESIENTTYFFCCTLYAGGTFSALLTGLKLLGDPSHERVFTSWTSDPSTGRLMHHSSPSIPLSLQYIDPVKLHGGDEVALVVHQDECLFHVSVLNDEEPIPHHALLPEWHFDMLRDSVRNQNYQDAIQAAIEFKHESGTSEVHVLDAGAGSGLLSLIAAKYNRKSQQLLVFIRCGAHKVSAVEFPGHISDLCEENIVMNGFYSKVQVIPKAMNSVNVSDLTSKADILTMEVFDCGLIGEGVLHILNSAWKSLLKDDAIVIPCGAALFAQPMQLNRVDQVAGFDVSLLNTYKWRPEYEEVDLCDGDHHYLPLGSPCKVFSFDFYQMEDCLEHQRNEVEVVVNQSGVLNAIVFWFELFLDDERILSTSPYGGNIERTWGQAVQWVKEREVEDGTLIHLQAKHDTNGFSFEVLNEDLRDAGVPLVDPSWKAKFEIVQSMNQAMVKSISGNPEEYRKLTNKAILYASRPGDFGLNPREAVSFCSKLFQ